jgi:hypothetical protein
MTDDNASLGVFNPRELLKWWILTFQELNGILAIEDNKASVETFCSSLRGGY